jgi:hypothetical protein
MHPTTGRWWSAWSETGSCHRAVLLPARLAPDQPGGCSYATCCMGQRDMNVYNASTDTGWLVDTFGHISQSPQIHNLFGILAVYVWRGVPRMQPYFHWVGPDGSRLFTINLFGGYRNLYGVTHAPEIAVARLQAELDKLGPIIPLETSPFSTATTWKILPKTRWRSSWSGPPSSPKTSGYMSPRRLASPHSARSSLEHLPAILGS